METLTAQNKIDLIKTRDFSSLKDSNIKEQELKVLEELSRSEFTPHSFLYIISTIDYGTKGFAIPDISTLKINVINNIKTPNYILEKIVENTNNKYILKVVCNIPNINNELIEFLFNQDNEIIRTSLAGNMNIDKKYLEELSEDEEERVAFEANETIETIERIERMGLGQNISNDINSNKGPVR